MKSVRLVKWSLVIAIVFVCGMSADARHRGHRRACHDADCVCYPPEVQAAMRQTVARLSTRVAFLQQFVNAQNAKDISATAKAEINRQLELIGVAARPVFEPAVGDNADLVQILNQASIDAIEGEIGPIRDNLRVLRQQVGQR